MDRATQLAEHRQKLGIDQVEDRKFDRIIVEGEGAYEHAFIRGIIIRDRQERSKRRD